MLFLFSPTTSINIPFEPIYCFQEMIDQLLIDTFQKSSQSNLVEKLTTVRLRY